MKRTPLKRSTKPLKRTPIKRSKPRPLRPVDGEFVHSVSEREKVCAEAGHPLEFINLSLSRPGAEVRRCLCGKADQSPKILKRPNRKRPGPARRVSVVRDQKYMDWCKTKQCVACASRGHDWRAFPVNLPLSATIDPAHTAPTNGMSSKGPDSSCVPLCRWHHDEMDGRVSPRVTTKEQFAAKYGLDLAAIAADHYARFKGEN